MTSSIVEHLAQSGHLDRRFIDGEWVRPQGQGRATVIDPSSEEPVAQIALGDAQDVDQAVAAARRAFGAWSTSAPQDRAALLARVHAFILERTEPFAQAISLEMGAAIATARAAPVPIAAEHIRVARDIVASYPFVTERDGMAIVREPIGAGMAEGAALLCGGLGRPAGLERGSYARPTVFSQVRPQMRIAQEETFGPVLCVIAYDGVDEAVAIANGTVFGLGAHAPFGGYKRSGNGREYGLEGFQESLETKAILGWQGTLA